MAHTVRAISEGVIDAVFLDTAYAVALAVENDQYHDRAIQLVDQIEQENVQLVTTRAVVTEIGNALAAPEYRGTAVAHISALQRNPTADVVPLTEELFRRGFALYRERQDKEWGITDCISFVTMCDRNLQAALTTDRDFEQAGFTVLLRSWQSGSVLALVNAPKSQKRTIKDART